MRIRQFQCSDYDSVVAIWKSTGLTLKDVDTLPAIEKFVSLHPDLFLVAESDGQVVGTVIGAWDGRRGWIYHLAVRPDFQSRGFARRLMEKIELCLRERGATQINLLVGLTIPKSSDSMRKSATPAGRVCCSRKYYLTDDRNAKKATSFDPPRMNAE